MSNKRTSSESSPLEVEKNMKLRLQDEADFLNPTQFCSINENCTPMPVKKKETNVNKMNYEIFGGYNTTS